MWWDLVTAFGASFLLVTSLLWPNIWWKQHKRGKVYLGSEYHGRGAGVYVRGYLYHGRPENRRSETAFRNNTSPRTCALLLKQSWLPTVAPAFQNGTTGWETGVQIMSMEGRGSSDSKHNINISVGKEDPGPEKAGPQSICWVAKIGSQDFYNGNPYFLNYSFQLMPRTS